GGPLDLPLRRIPELAPWFARFGVAAFRQAKGTGVLAPLVKPAAATLDGWLQKIGHGELLRRNGHYEVWFGPTAASQASAQERAMRHLGVRVESAPDRALQALRTHSRRPDAAALWFPDSGHVLDPLKVVQAFVQDACGNGAVFNRTVVREIAPRQ